jgi:hypothetical protein
MRIEAPELSTANGKTRIQCRFSSAKGNDVLWYEVDEKHASHLVTERMDGFLIGLLPLAMSCGEPLELKGALSKQLFFGVSNYYTKLVKIVLPDVSEIRISPDCLIEDFGDRSNRAVAAGFSGGIDSFCVLADHYFAADIPEGYRITHLFFNNVGSHGRGEGTRALFQQRYERTKTCAEEMGLDLIRVDSNLGEIIKHKFRKTHPLRNMSVALLFQKLLSKYFYASGVSYRDTHISSSYSIAHADPLALPLLATETFRPIPTGSQYSRIQKTAKVAELPVARKWINVCVDPEAEGRNCSQCYKCCQTLMALELLNRIQEFGQSFDLKEYKKAKPRFIARLFWEKDPLNTEIIKFAAERGYDFPLLPKIQGKIRGLGRQFKRKKKTPA